MPSRPSSPQRPLHLLSAPRAHPTAGGRFPISDEKGEVEEEGRAPTLCGGGCVDDAGSARRIVPDANALLLHHLNTAAVGEPAREQRRGSGTAAQRRRRSDAARSLVGKIVKTLSEGHVTSQGLSVCFVEVVVSPPCVSFIGGSRWEVPALIELKSLIWLALSTWNKWEDLHQEGHQNESKILLELHSGN
ncbi:unnamed protein product [Urochloa humidicola]